MIDQLCSRIWEHKSFHSEYDSLIRESVLSDLSELEGERGVLPRATIARLLQCATHFAAGNDVKFKGVAYRIASSSWKLYRSEFPNIEDVALVVFERLGNFPAISLMSGGLSLPAKTTLPPSLWFEILHRQASNSIPIDDNHDHVTLTDFQYRLWTSLTRGRSSAITAPTSSGKSFALQRFLALRLARKPSWCLYVVPTRALISQTADALRKVFESLAPGRLTVSTLPVAPSETGGDQGVYVITQERLLLLLDSGKAPDFEVAVIDEAQMLGDGARGVLLQSVLEALTERLPNLQILFGSPFTKNPEVFQSLLSLPDLEIISDSESPVAQNLIFLDSAPILANEVTISALVGNTTFDIGSRTLRGMLADRNQTLAMLSWEFGKAEQSIVYAGGTAACEDIADKLFQLTDSPMSLFAEKPPTEELIQFSLFVQEHVHPKYALARTVHSGIGFHYGRMPSVIRSGVEQLFTNGHLSHLVCTSTLLHGVNLPAKNLFLLNPTKGKDWEDHSDIPISGVDFWNLAGRAGRMGKEFEGNVFMINRSQWISNPLNEVRQQEVHPAFDSSVLAADNGFLKYIQDEDHASGASKTFENSFVKTFNDLRAGRLERTLNRVYAGRNAAGRKAIENALAECSAKITLPREITERHVNVSVFRQQEMYDYLLGKVAKDGPQRFVPMHPLRPFKEVNDNLRSVFKRIHTHFEHKPGKDKSQFYFAPLAIRWMRGEPLRRLIEEAEEYNKRQSRRVGIATLIRNMMGTVENDLRFRYVKYVSCYSDILTEVFKQTKNETLIEAVPPLPMFLELGASSTSMITLISLGLSRTTAGLVAGISVDKELDREQARRFLKGRDWSAADLPSVVIAEVSRLASTL